MRKIFVLLTLTVCWTMIAPAGLAGKPQPPPEPQEPFGYLDLTGSLQLAIISDGYLRLYDWDDDSGGFVHQWSGAGTGGAVSGCVIGDIDNDGSKELASFGKTSEVVNKQTVDTYYLKVWEDGAHSDSPTYSTTITAYGWAMEVGDVDSDGINELVVLVAYGDVQVWDFNYDDNKKISHATNAYTTLVTKVGSMGLTLGDADGDSVDEIFVGGAYNENGNFDSRAMVLDYQNGQYARAAYIGVKVVDDISIGDLDGNTNNGNEILMSGNTGGKIMVWRYDSVDKQYEEVWTGSFEQYYTMDYLQSNEIADIDGDGDKEGVAGTQVWDERVKGKMVYHYNTYIVRYDQSSGAWSLSAHTPTCSADVDAMVSGDVDGNGDSELVVSGSVLDWDDSQDTLVRSQKLAGGVAICLG